MKNATKALVITPIIVSLASCMDTESSKPDPYYGNSDQGRIVGGIEGIHYASHDVQADRGSTIIEDIEGTTNVAGLFEYGVAFRQVCTTESDGKTTCRNAGSGVFSPMSFSICRVALPQMPGPDTDVGSRIPAYTPAELFTDPIAARNFATIALMGNVLDGDPALTGIKLASSLQGGTCQDFNWHTTNIQQDAASFQQVARNDGRSHEWPSEQAVTDYMDKVRRCSQAGYYFGTQSPSAETAGRLTPFGNFDVFIDFDGRLEGFIDYGGNPNLEPLVFAGLHASFSGQVEGNQFRYSGPSGISGLPTLDVSVDIYAHDSVGTWTSGTMGGTTEDAFPYVDESDRDLGLSNSYNVRVPKYRFLAKDIPYTQQGRPTRNHILRIDVSYNKSARGSLNEWPPLRKDDVIFPDPEPLVFEGGLTKKQDALVMKWWESSEFVDMTFDPSNVTLTGTMKGPRGNVIATFTQAEPLRGCRL